MPRSARKAPGGVVFHALNRGVGRRTLFHKDPDFAAFERILEQALSLVPVLGLHASLRDRGRPKKPRATSAAKS
jgi:hypothetical protein